MSSPRMQFVGAGALGVLLGVFVGLGQARAGSSLETCLAGCKRAGLSATNRASCRLDCEADAASDPDLIRAKIAPLPPRKPAASGAVASARGPGCEAACDADAALSADDRATCKLECNLEPAPMPTGTPPPMRPAKPATAATSTPRAGTAAPVAAPTRGIPVAAPSRSASNQAEFLARCHATCTPGRNEREATDYESCKLDCDTMASVLDVAAGLVPDAWMATPRNATRIEPLPVPAAAAPASKPARTAARPSAPSGDTCGPDLQTCRASCVKTETKCAKACSRKHLSETDRETCKLGCGTDQEVCQGDCLTATATCVNSRYAPRGG